MNSKEILKTIITTKGYNNKIRRIVPPTKNSPLSGAVSSSKSVARQRGGIVVVHFFNGADNYIVAVIFVHRNRGGIADTLAEDGLAERRFLAHKAA